MKNTRIVQSLAALLVVFCLVSCASEGDGARDAARENITATQTATNTPPATPAADPATPAAPTGPTTSMAFAETEFDFGLVDDGEKVTHVYKFDNTGDEPLIISNAKGSCGCTVPKWPKEPIPVGGSGQITVQFDSKNKAGKQSKRVTITANTDPPQSFLTIKGEVKKKEGAPETPTATPVPTQ